MRHFSSTHTIVGRTAPCARSEVVLWVKQYWQSRKKVRTVLFSRRPAAITSSRLERSESPKNIDQGSIYCTLKLLVRCVRNKNIYYPCTTYAIGLRYDTLLFEVADTHLPSPRFAFLEIFSSARHASDGASPLGSPLRSVRAVLPARTGTAGVWRERITSRSEVRSSKGTG